MTQQQKNLPFEERKQEQAETQDRPEQSAAPQAGADNDATMPPTNDAGDAISEGTLADASGAETGGGTDTPDAVEQSTQDAIKKQKPLHLGTSL